MYQKQNIFCVCATIIFGGVGFCLSPAVAAGTSGESTATNAALAPQPDLNGPFQVLDEWLKFVRARDHNRAFALLSTALHDKYQKNDRVFMNTVRLTQHALYDHESYRLLTPVTQKVSGDQMMVKIQWIDRNGHETLGLIHMIEGPDGAWRVDGVTVLDNGQARDA